MGTIRTIGPRDRSDISPFVARTGPPALDCSPFFPFRLLGMMFAFYSSVSSPPAPGPRLGVCYISGGLFGRFSILSNQQSYQLVICENLKKKATCRLCITKQTGHVLVEDPHVQVSIRPVLSVGSPQCAPLRRAHHRPMNTRRRSGLSLPPGFQPRRSANPHIMPVLTAYPVRFGTAHRCTESSDLNESDGMWR
jgi:hypothetical protein